MGIFIPKAQQTFIKEMPRIQHILEDSQVERVQAKLIEEYLNTIFVEGVLQFYVAPNLEQETDEYETFVIQACFTIGLVVDTLKPSLLNCSPFVVESLFDMY